LDGFRFDLASVLVRDHHGVPMHFAPAPWRIEFSNILANTAIIAAAWDAAGLYQVGDFPGFRWAEWNGQYRDVIRRFVRGDKGLIGEVASRLSGSSDLYEWEGRVPSSSINFVTCHDGFTLYDLVSYNGKHNEANGEKNREMLRFVTKMISFRKRHPCLMRKHFLTGKQKEGAPLPDVTRHGTKLNEPLWNNPDAQILAYTLGRLKEGEEDVHVIFNMSDHEVDMPLPSLYGRAWHRAIDTGQPSPGDVLEPADQPRKKESFYRVSSHSFVVFESR